MCILSLVSKISLFISLPDWSLEAPCCWQRLHSNPLESCFSKSAERVDQSFLPFSLETTFQNARENFFRFPESIFYYYSHIVRNAISVHRHRLKIWRTTRSVRDECMKARLIRSRWFVMIICSQKSLVSSSIWSVIFRRVYELLPAFLNASRRNRNLPQFQPLRENSGSGNHPGYRQRRENLCTISDDSHWSYPVVNREISNNALTDFKGKHCRETSNPWSEFNYNKS